jgi:hypothetical protein
MASWASERGFTPRRPRGARGERGATPGRFTPGFRLAGGEGLTVEGRGDLGGASRRPQDFSGSLSIRALKEFVFAQFPEGHPLREVVLAERDRLTPAEFLAKMEVWIVLLSRRV